MSQQNGREREWTEEFMEYLISSRKKERQNKWSTEIKRKGRRGVVGFWGGEKVTTKA